MFDGKVLNANSIWAGWEWKLRGTAVEIYDVDKARGNAQQARSAAE